MPNILDLPPELLTEIFYYLPNKDLERVATLHPTLHLICEDIVNIRTRVMVEFLDGKTIRQWLKISKEDFYRSISYSLNNNGNNSNSTIFQMRDFQVAAPDIYDHVEVEDDSEITFKVGSVVNDKLEKGVTEIGLGLRFLVFTTGGFFAKVPKKVYSLDEFDRMTREVIVPTIGIKHVWEFLAENPAIVLDVPEILRNKQKPEPKSFVLGDPKSVQTATDFLRNMRDREKNTPTICRELCPCLTQPFLEPEPMQESISEELLAENEIYFWHQTYGVKPLQGARYNPFLRVVFVETGEYQRMDRGYPRSPNNQIPIKRPVATVTPLQLALRKIANSNIVPYETMLQLWQEFYDRKVEEWYQEQIQKYTGQALPDWDVAKKIKLYVTGHMVKPSEYQAENDRQEREGWRGFQIQGGMIG